MKLFSRIKAEKELEQAGVRLLGGLMILIYMLIVIYQAKIGGAAQLNSNSQIISYELILSLTYFSVMLLMFIVQYFHLMPPVIARTMALVIEIALFSIALALITVVMLPIVFLIYWIIIGHAFRFGRQELLRATVIALAGVTIAIIFGPYWHTHPAMAFWLLVSLILIPSYIGLFLRRENKVLAQLADEKARATQASEEKSNFLANVSHELRTPLNGVTTVGELLMGTELDDKQREYAEVITTSSKVLLSLINNILDYSKIESGFIEMDNISFSLRDVITTVITILNPMATNKNISLDVRYSDLLPEHVNGDPTKITQILINMANNAIKFTEHGYTLINVYPVNAHTDQVVVRFEVIDTGIGISESAKDRIFDRFHQEDASITRKYGGTGLGTAISKKLVDYMGGSIGVSSEVGVGSRFWFELPLQVTAAAEHVAIEQNVVVFSQNPKLVHQLKQTVEIWDFSVDVYAGINVIERYTNAGVEKVPAAVVLDFALAGEAAKLIERIEPRVKNSINFILIGFDRLNDHKLLSLFDSMLPVPLNTRQLYHALFFQDSKGDEVVTPITAAAAIKHRPPKAIAELNILICDDEPTNRYVLRELLETMGHTVSQCENGFEALDLLQENDYDMAIIDLQMPEMSGLEVAELYQYAVSDNRIPLILASANVRADFIEKSKSYFDAYIEKPIDYQKLSATITQIHEQSIANRQRIRFDLSRVMQTIVFDPAEFANYPKEAMEGEFLSSLFEIFIESANKNLAKIKYALERQDINGFKAQMHSLKGISGNVKAKQLEAIARKCQEIDRESFEDSDNATYILDTLQTSLNETRQLLFAYLREEFRKNS